MQTLMLALAPAASASTVGRAELPDGVTAGAEPVTLQVVLDHEGAVRRALAIGGPAALTAPAIAAMTTWRAEPARVNGAPIAVPFVVQAAFKPTTPE